MNRKAPGNGPAAALSRVVLAALAAVSAVEACTAAAAPRQPPPELVTDRPDQTESPRVLPPRYGQLEAGWSHGERDDGGERVTADSFPETLVRVGLGGRWELRVGFQGYRWIDVDPATGPGSRTDGSADTSLGFKFGITEERGWRPEIGLLAAVSLPTGDEPFSSERADVLFRGAFAHTLNERISLGYNLGVEFVTEEGANGDRDTQSEGVWTVVLGIAGTECLAFFVEAFGGVGLSRRLSPENGVDGGLTYLVRDNLQLDLFAGFGTSDSADDWFVGSGVSYRFPE